MWIRMLLAAAVSLSMASSASAWTRTTVELGELTIVEPMAFAAAKGGQTSLMMGVANEGRSTVHIIGLTTPVAREARFRLQTDVDAETTVEALSVPAADAREPEASTVRVRLVGLSRPLSSGETIPVTLYFANGATVTVDVPVTARASAWPAHRLGG